MAAPAALLAMTALAASCGSGGGGGTTARARRTVTVTVASSATATPPATTVAAGPACPRGWVAAWRAVARRAHLPALCPTWLPTPLNGQLGSQMNTERSAAPGVWQVGFVEVDPGFAGLLHVVLEGFGPHAWPPVCEDTVRRHGRVVPVRRPCFAGPAGHEQVGGRDVTWYTRNRAIETGHVAAVFPIGASTYAVGMHVYAPLTRRTTQAALRRIVRGLAVVPP